MIQSKEKPKEEKKKEVIEENGFLTVNVSALNFREGPSLKNKVKRILPNGEKVENLKEQKEADGYTWTKVKDAKGETGWIATIYADIQN